MRSTFAKRVLELEALDTETNFDECLARAHAESNKARGAPGFYAWNRVIQALWDVRKLDERDVASETGKLEGT